MPSPPESRLNDKTVLVRVDATATSRSFSFIVGDRGALATTARGGAVVVGSGSNSLGARRFLPVDVGGTTVATAETSSAGVGSDDDAALAFVRSRCREAILALSRSICPRYRF